MYFVEVYSEVGAGKHGTNHGVAMLSKHCEQMYPNVPVTKIFNHQSAEATHSQAKYIENLTPFFAQELVPILKDKLLIGQTAGQFPVVLSGDHANALGNLSAFLSFHQHKKVAVLWIDAHADMHSVYTTPSGNLHGMPLAAVMGLDNKEHAINEVDEVVADHWTTLKQLNDNVYGLPFTSVFFLGLRSFELPEAALIEQGAMFAYSADEHRQAGFEQVLDKLSERLAQFDVVYVSFDVDALDDSLIAATGTPEPKGYSQAEMKKILSHVLALPQVGLFEVTEFNPVIDDDSDKHQVIFELLDDALTVIQNRSVL